MKRLMLFTALAITLAPLGAEAKSASPTITWIEATSPGIHNYGQPQIVICGSRGCYVNAVNYTATDPDSATGRHKFEVLDANGVKVGGEPYRRTGEIPFDGSVISGLWRHHEHLSPGFYQFRVTVRDAEGNTATATSNFALYI